MTRFLNIVTLMLSIISFQCSAQPSNETWGVEESIDAMAPGTAFTLERDDVFLELDYPGLSGAKGMTVLAAYLNKHGALNGFKIMKLKVQSDDVNYVDFVDAMKLDRPRAKQDYPVEVQRLYPLIEEYVNRLAFKRDGRFVVREVNKLIFMAKLD